MIINNKAIKEPINYLGVYCDVFANYARAVNLLSDFSYDLHSVGGQSGGGEGGGISLTANVLHWHLEKQKDFFEHDLRSAIQLEKLSLKMMFREKKAELKAAYRAAKEQLQSLPQEDTAAAQQPSKALVVAQNAAPANISEHKELSDEKKG